MTRAHCVRRTRGHEAGRRRGCIGTTILIIPLLCLAAFFAGRLLAVPDLGPSPQGPDHGDSPESIAAHLASSAVAQLTTAPDAVVTLSEHDLTVIAQQSNPAPVQFVDPQARVRGGNIVVDATTAMGPLTVVATVTLDVTLVGVTLGDPQLQSEIVDARIGRQGIPGFFQSFLDPRGAGVLSLNAVLNDNPQLKSLQSSLECTRITPAGIEFGFHRPGAPARPAACNG